jgi:hypothetical protein
MKKTLLSVVALLGLTAATAQVYTANDSAAFAAWTSIDADGDTYGWFATDLTGAGSAIDGQGGCALSSSWISTGALTPDNILVSPIIDLTSMVETNLTWGAGSRETTASGFYAEHYAVYVVTDVVAITAGTFPTPIFEGDLTAGEIMETQSFDISTIADNQASVYIVVRHFNVTDMNFIVFDDVEITAGFVAVEESSLEVLSVYPNPSTDVLNITLNSNVETISILSLDGKLISKEVVNANNVALNVSNLSSGVYFYEAITAEGNKLRNKFVKK